MNFCLLAIEGDCAAGGISNKSDFIPLQQFNETLKAYLRNQLEKQIECNAMGLENISLRFSELVQEHHNLGNELINQGIFAHKWHKRTDWIITFSLITSAKIPNVSMKIARAKMMTKGNISGLNKNLLKLDSILMILHLILVLSLTIE